MLVYLILLLINNVSFGLFNTNTPYITTTISGTSYCLTAGKRCKVYTLGSCYIWASHSSSDNQYDLYWIKESSGDCFGWEWDDGKLRSYDWYMKWDNHLGEGNDVSDYELNAEVSVTPSSGDEFTYKNKQICSYFSSAVVCCLETDSTKRNKWWFLGGGWNDDGYEAKFDCTYDGDKVNFIFECTPDNPCDEDEGDCNTDEDCSGGLRCGNNNCGGSNAQWLSNEYDCCYVGEWTCTQGDTYDGCCNSGNLCDVGEGDCDTDDDCIGDLVCGNNNCGGTDAEWPTDDYDCCRARECIPGDTYDGCCNSGNVCDVGEGDCDWDEDCLPGLVCGDANCGGTDAGWPSDVYDCCEDINECNDANICGDNSGCINTPGSYYCTCNEGYQSQSGDGENCEDIDECTDENTINVCGTNSVCINTDGSYGCTCNAGYESQSGNGNDCEDIDECNDANICGDNSGCTNTPGSYYCTCNAGYESQSGDNKDCDCPDGYKSGDDGKCRDIDECLEDNECVAGTGICVDTAGSYRCECKTGYESSSDGKSCININECLEDNKCVAGTGICVDTAGSYRCQCKTGYESSSDGKSCIANAASNILPFKLLLGFLVVVNIAIFWYQQKRYKTLSLHTY